MKIALNTSNNDFYNIFFLTAKEQGIEIINAKNENLLFEVIDSNEIDAFVISNDSPYYKRAADFIKKHHPYTPLIGLSVNKLSYNVLVDFYMVFPTVWDKHKTEFIELSKTIIFNVQTYVRTFDTLQRLTAKMQDKIEFAQCVYDPTRRILYHKGKEVKKLSSKEGGILELLASNYGQVVKKEIILEKVWRKNDYFAGRSMDVYITYLRNTLRNNNIKLNIKNISGIGLILE